MKKFFAVAGVITVLGTSLAYNMANASDNGPRPNSLGGVMSSVGSDGSRAAEAGTRIYNNNHPDHPLPIHHGDDAIIRGTLKNMGAGMPPGKALDKAIADETNIPEAKSVKEEKPVKEASPAPATQHPEVHQDGAGGGHPAGGHEIDKSLHGGESLDHRTWA